MSRTGNYVPWLEAEDLYCVKRFIENYLKDLIQFGRVIKSKEMTEEVKLYNGFFPNKRTDASVILKFHNIESLAFKMIEDKGNPYNVKILERLPHNSKQASKAWTSQIKQYSDNINKWLNKE